MATFGGYVGLGLAGQARSADGLYRRGLLAGAAWSLGLGIWTMHFVGMLAAQLPGRNAVFDAVLEEAMLYAPSWTLRGGTREILRGIIARGLGLR